MPETQEFDFYVVVDELKPMGDRIRKRRLTLGVTGSDEADVRDFLADEYPEYVILIISRECPDA